MISLIFKIHKLEHESDRIEKQISKKEIFNLQNLNPITIIHLLKITDRLGCIADHAENAGDLIRFCSQNENQKPVFCQIDGKSIFLLNFRFLYQIGF